MKLNSETTATLFKTFRRPVGAADDKWEPVAGSASHDRAQAVAFHGVACMMHDLKWELCFVRVVTKIDRQVLVSC